jgi:HSP20 family protein
MQLMPWKRQDGVERGVTLRDAMNQLFDESFWDPMHFFSDNALMPAQRQWQFLPSFDVSETDKELQIVADVPGYDPKDVNVRIDNGVLTIEGKMEEDKEEKNKKWYRRETSRGNFMRQLSLPQGISDKDVKCKMKNGKLTISVQKPKEIESQGKTLQIESE